MSKPSVKTHTGKAMKWKDREYPTVYANLMAFGMTPYDIAFVFGEVGDATDTEVIGIPRVKLLLSPEQAANLARLLKVALEAYVTNNGNLRLAGAVQEDDISKQLESQRVQ